MGMRKKGFYLYQMIVAAILLFLGLYGLPLSAQKQVYVAKYDGVINPVAAEYFSQVIRKANEDHATALLMELDTPGGLDESMRDIVKEISNSDVPVIVYVSPTGARAASAGVFITLSAHVAAMTPGTNIGGEGGKERERAR